MLPFGATAPIRCSRAPQLNVTSFMQIPAIRRSRWIRRPEKVYPPTILYGQFEFRFIVSGKARQFSSLDSLRSFERQSRQRQPSVSVGIGRCGSSAHQQFPFGSQVIGALQRAQRVSMRAIIAQIHPGSDNRACLALPSLYLPYGLHLAPSGGLALTGTSRNPSRVSLAPFSSTPPTPTST